MSGRPEAGWRRYLRFWGQDVRADVDEELRHHLELCTSVPRTCWCPWCSGRWTTRGGAPTT